MSEESGENEQAGLAEFIDAAVQAYFAQSGKAGISLGFVALVEAMDADGEMVAVVAQRPNQPVYRSLGYAEYLGEWFRDDARVGMSAFYAGVDFDDEDE